LVNASRAASTKSRTAGEASDARQTTHTCSAARGSSMRTTAIPGASFIDIIRLPSPI